MKKLLSILFIIVLSLFSASCSKDKKEEVKIKQITTIPKELVAVEDNVNKVEEILLKLKEESQKSGEVEAEKEKEEMIKKLQKEKSKETDETTDKIKVVETHKEKIEKIWTSLDKEAEKGHKTFDKYKLKAIEDKANEKQIEQIEDNLNNLTIFLENRDFLNSFTSNNKIYNDISYFLSLYEDYEREISKLKYQTNNIYIYALKDEWDTALEGMNQVNSQYNDTLKEFNKGLKSKEKPTKQDKEKEESLEKLKLSIDSLEQSIKKKDISLLKIKRDIVFSNIEKVEN